MPLRRRTVLINGGLVVVLAGVAVVGWTTLASGSSTSTGRTATVQKGTVLATVAATGHRDQPGRRRGVVLEHRHRHQDRRRGRRQGQEEPDPGHDRRPVRPPGPRLSPRLPRQRPEPARDRGGHPDADAGGPGVGSSLTQAQSQVDSAERNLSYTKSANALNATGYNRSVSQAQTAYNQAVSAQQAACSGGSSPACSAAKKNTTQAHQQLQSATLTRQQNLLRDSKSLADAQAQVTSAQQSLSSTQAQNTAATQPESALQLAAAKAQVDSAQAQVEAAEKALTATTLRAPAAGTVASIAGKVGDAASNGSSSSNGSSTTSTRTRPPGSSS